MTPIELFLGWVGLVGTLVSMFLAIKVEIQSRKVKTLSDVVDKLEKNNKTLMVSNEELLRQGKVLSNHFELHRQVSLKERVPFLKVYRIDTENNQFRVECKNVGADCKDIQLFSQESDYFKITLLDKKPNRGDIFPLFTVSFAEIWFYNEHVSFTIATRNDDDLLASQKVVKPRGDKRFYLEPPIDYVGTNKLG